MARFPKNNQHISVMLKRSHSDFGLVVGLRVTDYDGFLYVCLFSLNVILGKNRVFSSWYNNFPLNDITQSLPKHCRCGPPPLARTQY